MAEIDLTMDPIALERATMSMEDLTTQNSILAKKHQRLSDLKKTEGDYLELCDGFRDYRLGMERQLSMARIGLQTYKFETNKIISDFRKDVENLHKELHDVKTKLNVTENAYAKSQEEYSTLKESFDTLKESFDEQADQLRDKIHYKRYYKRKAFDLEKDYINEVEKSRVLKDHIWYVMRKPQVRYGERVYLSPSDYRDLDPILRDFYGIDENLSWAKKRQRKDEENDNNDSESDTPLHPFELAN